MILRSFKLRHAAPRRAAPRVFRGLAALFRCCAQNFRVNCETRIDRLNGETARERDVKVKGVINT